MIYHASMRTDIPAFYSKWFYNRIKQGYFCVSNPYNDKISKHSLQQNVTDLLMFCTKNPEPMLSQLDLLKSYKQSWHITITPYSTDIEPNVPNKKEIIKAVNFLSSKIGQDKICWRYDPILITDKYNVDFHINCFEKMAFLLKESVKCVIISFVHIYPKLQTLAPFIHEVTYSDKIKIINSFSQIADKYKLKLKLCGEKIPSLNNVIDQRGCETLQDLQHSIGYEINLPQVKPKRQQCSCYLGIDMGSYNCCPHLCRYCYANNQVNAITTAFNTHNPDSPILIGDIVNKKITLSKDISFRCQQMLLF